MASERLTIYGSSQTWALDLQAPRRRIEHESTLAVSYPPSVPKCGMIPFVATTPVGDIPMTNLVGLLHGESPTVIILAGHYDTAKLDGVRFVGANDGGSSVAFLLEMARALSRRKNKLT